MKNSNGRNGSDGAATRPGRRLYDIEQTGVFLGVSRWTVKRLIDDGTLPVVSLPAGNDRSIRRLLIDSIDIDRLIERSKNRENGA